MTSPFEAIVRPILGDAYDSAFPHRRSADVNILDAKHTPDEAHMVATLADMYVAANTVEDVKSRDKIRNGIVLALKSLRKAAELRKQKYDAILRMDERPLYRYRGVAPDGTELSWPTRATVKANKRCALFWRRVPKPVEGIRVAVEGHYINYMNEAKTEQRREDLLLSIERDIVKEVKLQAELNTDWAFKEMATLPRALTKRADWCNINVQTDRYYVEAIVVEGDPYCINQGAQ